VLIGHRGVIRVRGNHVKVVGNFINPQYPLTSPDVENIVVGSDDPSPDLVMEHNVLRSGEWVLRECQGEVRYNLIADMNGHAWIKGPHDCNVHHNIFVNYETPDPNREAGIDAVYFTPHLDIYNNTFDGGGTIANLGVPAIHEQQRDHELRHSVRVRRREQHRRRDAVRHGPAARRRTHALRRL
jgi:hypothetical protein